MRAADVMTTKVRTVPPQMPAADAFQLMRVNGIHHLVVTEDSAILGILSNRDAGGRSGTRLRAQSSVGDLMTTAVVTVSPTETVQRIANLMRGRTIGCVPVVDGGRLKGIVTVSDLLALLGLGLDRPSKPQRAFIHYRTPHRKQHRAHSAW